MLNWSNISDYRGGKRYSVQWWVSFLLRLRRTAKLPDYSKLRWESPLELQFSEYFALKGDVSRAKNLVQAFEIIRLIEASPKERAARCQKSPHDRKLVAKMQAWNKKPFRWEDSYIAALDYLCNAHVGVEPAEAEVRELAIRVRAWSDLVSTGRYEPEDFNVFVFSPAPRDSRFERVIQAEIAKLRKDFQPTWSRLTRRHRVGLRRKKSRLSIDS